MDMNQEEKDRAMEYLNWHGFYIVTSPNQQEIVNELVKEGLLIQAGEDLFEVKPAPTNIYVHPYVDRKEKMPCNLYKLVYAPPSFFKGEMVYVSLSTSNGNNVNVLARVEAVRTNVVEVSIHNSCVIVPLKDVKRTFKN